MPGSQEWLFLTTSGHWCHLSFEIQGEMKGPVKFAVNPFMKYC